MMPMRAKRRVSRRSRRGVSTLEAIMVVPILVILTAAAIQFALVMIFSQAVDSAANEATREVAKVLAPTTPNQHLVAAGVVNQILGVHGRSTASPGVRMRFEQFGSPAVFVGDGSVTIPPPVQALNMNEVRVTVAVNYVNGPAPNLLDYFGVDLSTRRYQASAIAQYQTPPLP